MARKNIGFMTTEYSEIFSKTVTQGAMFAAEEEDNPLTVLRMTKKKEMPQMRHNY